MSPTQKRPGFFSWGCKRHQRYPWAFGGSWISLSEDSKHLLFLWTMWKQYQKGNWRHPQVSISRFARFKLWLNFLLLCSLFSYSSRESILECSILNEIQLHVLEFFFPIKINSYQLQYSIKFHTILIFCGLVVEW